ncbi:MAG: trehalose-phosphatase [Candidatus Omnitrophica bacterium]|nr:trehalose-phosphatase [Candidatus Omnitrophota bacterium]
MKPLFSNWQDIAPMIRDRSLLLCLDYDGTLTPIVRRPSLAKFSATGKKILRNLVSMDDIRIAIVSGRSLSEIKSLVGVSGIVYAGNHGFELEGPYLHYVHPAAPLAKKVLKKIFNELKEALESLSGIFIENKIFTLSVHYREVKSSQVETARAIFLKSVTPHLESSQIVLTEGKKVWEVRPAVRWHKGTTVLWLLGRVLAQASKRVLPIYIGDDQTDEDAFKAMKRKGLSIKVNDPGTHRMATKADYYVSSPNEALKFLNWVKKTKEESCAECPTC